MIRAGVADGLPVARAPRRARLRALFEDAWRRQRRRRQLIGASLVIAVAASSFAVVLGRDGRSPVVSPPAAMAPLALRQQPMVGVACPGKGNDVSCDRVGVALWLDSHPARLTATIDGRTTVLADMHMRCRANERCGGFYSGYIDHAGLIDGALRVTPDHGRLWYGNRPVAGVLHLRAEYRDGRVATTTRRVELSPGFG